MALWILNLISTESLLGITPWILILVGLLVEKHYVGRIATFTNTLAINIHFSTIQNLDKFFILYANLGLIFGIIAIFSYTISKYGNRLGLPREYYIITNRLFSSIVVGILMLIIN